MEYQNEYGWHRSRCLSFPSRDQQFQRRLYHVLDHVVRGVPVIRVQHENIFARGKAMPPVDRVVDAVIPGADIGYPALVAELFEQLHRTVRGRAVHNDMLHRAVGLVMHRLEILQQKVLSAVLQTVQRHGNDGNKRMPHGSPRKRYRLATKSSACLMHTS